MSVYSLVAGLTALALLLKRWPLVAIVVVVLYVVLAMLILAWLNSA